jgi:hypothetical protein
VVPRGGGCWNMTLPGQCLDRELWPVWPQWLHVLADLPEGVSSAR